MDTEELAARNAGDGMPIGNQFTLPIQRTQVEAGGDGTTAPMFEDDAAATIVWEDFQKAMSWLETESWLMEWQYIDYVYQSPNYDRDWRTHSSRPARISRFNVAKNTNTMKNQVRRSIFGDKHFFLLEPQGKMASDPQAQTLIDAWSELLLELCTRADFEYQFGRLFIACQTLQGTAIAVPRWEQRKVKKRWRTPKKQPVKIEMPLKQASVQVHTWESDDWKKEERTVLESWPLFEYRRLGTTIYCEKWRTPGRPDLTGEARFDVDYVEFQQLQEMRELSCYKDIPQDEELIKYFLSNPDGDAQMVDQFTQGVNANSIAVVHAESPHRQVSKNPFSKPMLKISRWTEYSVTEILCYESRRKVIRNEQHTLGDHALGYSANWFDIDNSGYGFGIGRLNAGDQRMSQGVLNEALKMIAFPMNAPLIYDADSGNAPTQNAIAGLGTFLAVRTGSSHDINKALGFLRVPEIPPEAWKIYQLATEGGEDLVGANKTTMQGQNSGPGSSMARTATGASRLSDKADENISDPVSQDEMVIERFLRFLHRMVAEEMPISEIRQILGDKFSDAILKTIDAEQFLNADFSIKILAGDKLRARAAISQLIPFLLQLVQQPQLMEYMHQKGWTVNYLTIEKLFMQVSELAGREDIIVPLTAQEKQMLQAMQPGMQAIKGRAAIEDKKNQGKLAAIDRKGQVDLGNTIAERSLDHVEGAVPLDLAEARLARNTDMSDLQTGVVQ